MYGLFGRATVRNLSAEEVAEGVTAGRYLLIDVREGHEAAEERIAGAILVPLSQLDPLDLPNPQGREVVFYCASGARSAKAAEIAQAAGLAYEAHLAGGLRSWKSKGLPLETP